MTDWFESGAMIFHMAQTQAFRDGTVAVPYGLCSVRLLFPPLALSINRRPLSHGLRRASVSLRLGHGAANVLVWRKRDGTEAVPYDVNRVHSIFKIAPLGYL